MGDLIKEMLAQWFGQGVRSVISVLHINIRVRNPVNVAIEGLKVREST